jgi:short-subunit dehydrogenase
VTGSTSGIGEAIASQLAKQGAVICLSGRDSNRLEARAYELRAFSLRVNTYPCDLVNDGDIDGLHRRITEEHGRLDILVHSAGVIAHGKLGDAPVELLERQFTANVRGPLRLTQLMLPLLKQPRGQIVFINSSSGLNARANAGHFSATQHAFKALADALREEVNADGIRVLSVFPGRTATPRIKALHALEGRPYRPEVLLQPEDVANTVVGALMLPWTAEVTNISIRAMQPSY